MPPERVEAFAPGRINLIGEHTDYNGGLCLPFAIERGVTVRGRRAPAGTRLEVRALDLGEEDAFDPGRHLDRASGWRAFVRGTAAELRAAGHGVPAATLEVTGTVPRGAGLASSAALEVALALALLALAGEQAPGPVALAQLCSRVERRWVGAETGLLDQLACVLGRRGVAVRLDMATLTATPVALDLRGWRLVTVDSGARHQNALSGYNTRRGECEEACRRLGISSLAAAHPAAASRLAEPLDRRLRHVAGENDRVDAAVRALGDGELDRLARLLDASHASLRDLYDASVPAVEDTVTRLHAAGAAGARMIGGGFGGSVLALLPPDVPLPAGAVVAEPGPGPRVRAG